jgi:hypothetical protein
LIEQTGQYRPDLTSSEGIRTWIQNTNNMVQVPMIKHYRISGLMSVDRHLADACVTLSGHTPLGPSVQLGSTC